uniref:Uncharacterized protein n=1 Tax=Timema shepardi TaxID=629360 RepID=A0A7R9G492_TIMSH|nr:unnamed protein product [Timema shepardi]
MSVPSSEAVSLLNGPSLEVGGGDRKLTMNVDRLFQEGLKEKAWPQEVSLCLDGALLGDIPARYTIPAIRTHEFPVVGVWVDPRVAPGFRYRVRPIQEQGQRKGQTESHYFFGGKALTLQSIGRGYTRRVTFEGDSLNDNDNYFWSDSWPLGFAFELEVTRPGEKYTLHDANSVAVGTSEIVEMTSPQEEVSHVILDDGSVEKTVRVRLLCKVEWFEGQLTASLPDSNPDLRVIVGQVDCKSDILDRLTTEADVMFVKNAHPLPTKCVFNSPSDSVVWCTPQVRGLAVVVKPKSGDGKARVVRVMNVTVGGNMRGFTLTPGVSDQCRRITVSGQLIGDVPIQYTVIGLNAYEIPVIGTYVDPRIVPGFDYRVRPAGGKHHLFQGRALTLTSVGPGYGKRLTFAPDLKCLNSPNNYLWSDSHPEGLGFEPRALHVGMRLAIVSESEELGEAVVFRTDYAQQEEKQEVVSCMEGTTVTKYIYVDVTCHVTLKSREDIVEAMRVSGTAVVVREPGQPKARLRRIENVGLASQLNLLFVNRQTVLVFYPL